MPSAAQIAWAKLRVLVTAISAVIILGVLVYLLSGGSLFRRRIVIRTYLADATGVAKDSPVRLNGVLIGKVAYVKLSGGADLQKVVEVGMSVWEQFLPLIPNDSKTDISAQTLVGDKFINITKGQSPRQIDPGGELATQPESNMVTRIDIPAFEARLQDVDAMLRDIEAGKGPLGELVQTDNIYRDLLSQLAAVQRDVKAAASTTGKAGRLLYGLDLYANLERPLERLDGDLARLQQGRGPAGRLLKDSSTYDQLQSTIADVRRSVAEFGQSAFVRTDGSYARWNKKVAALIEAVDDFSAGLGSGGQLFVSSRVYESLTGRVREIQQSLHEFRTHPRKFLRIDLDLF